MRDYLRWAVRRPRAWVAFLAMLAAIALTLGEGKPVWTGIVVSWTGFLWLLSVRYQYEEEHPDIAARREERFRAEVDKVLWRYEREAAARRRVEEGKGESLGSRGTE